MAVRRPIYYDQVDQVFRELTDAQLDIVSYLVRKKYSENLVNSATCGGRISPGSSGGSYVNIGSATDTKTLNTSYLQDNNATPPYGDGNFPSTLPATTGYREETTTTTSFRQYTPSISVSTTTLDNYAYLIWNNTLKGLQKEGNTTNIYDTIVADSINQIHYGDNVGCQYFGTALPTNGTWNQIQFLFNDTSYYNSTVAFYQYIKTARSDETNFLTNNSLNKTILRYEGLENGNPKLRSLVTTDITLNLITDILAKILEIRYPKYSLTLVGGADSTTDASTTYSSTNFGFLVEKFVYSAYSLSSVVLIAPSSQGYYRGTFVPQNNSYRYNTWALLPNGNA